MITNRNCQHLLYFLLFNDEPVQMRFDVPRQQIELEFFLLGLFRLFLLLRDRWLRLGYCGNRDAIAEVLLHELGDLRLQFFRRRKWWWWRWWLVLCHVKTNIESKRLRGNASSGI